LTRHELRKAYDRLREADDRDSNDAEFYLDAARDLYKAARRDADGDRSERALELARAAEAMTHVPEHLGHAADIRPEPAKGKRDRKEAPKAKRERSKGDDLPPPID
jgi:hypothetical protein